VGTANSFPPGDWRTAFPLSDPSTTMTKWRNRCDQTLCVDERDGRAQMISNWWECVRSDRCDDNGEGGRWSNVGARALIEWHVTLTACWSDYRPNHRL
jgi:hypothetical protein